MQGCVLIRAADRLLQGGEQVVVNVVALVVAQRGALGDALQLLCGDHFFAILHQGGEVGDFQRVDRLANIPATGERDAAQHMVLHLQRQPFFLCLLLQDADTALQRLFNLLRVDRLKLKDGAAADDGVVDVEVRVLGGGGDQGDLPVLQKFQQGLLLFFV